MPRGRVPPLSFGISTSRTGGGKYEPDDIRFQILKRFPFKSFSNATSDSPSTPAAPRFAFTRWNASQTSCFGISYGFASGIGSSPCGLTAAFGEIDEPLRSAHVTGLHRYNELVRPS